MILLYFLKRENASVRPRSIVLIILAGDFWQKNPPGGVSLAEQLVMADVPTDNTEKSEDPHSARAKGLNHFRQASRTILTEQMRAAEDPELQQHLEALRDTASQEPITASLLKRLQVISQEDIATNPKLRFAPIGVLSNFERHRFNHSQLLAWASYYDVPAFRWKLPIQGRWPEFHEERVLDQMYEDELGLWGYFARGAPVMLLDNVQPSKLLANGASGFLHSLSFLDDGENCAKVTAAQGFEGFITLDAPPHSINFQLHVAAHESTEGIESLMNDGTIVVPITFSDHKVPYTTTSLHSVLHNIPKKVFVTTHMVTLAFALTDFKVQGKTLDYFVVNLRPHAWFPHMDLRGFYVFLSRVRSFESLRLLSCGSKPQGLEVPLQIAAHSSTCNLDCWIQ